MLSNITFVFRGVTIIQQKPKAGAKSAAAPSKPSAAAKRKPRAASKATMVESDSEDEMFDSDDSRDLEVCVCVCVCLGAVVGEGF